MLRTSLTLGKSSHQRLVGLGKASEDLINVFRAARDIVVWPMRIHDSESIVVFVLEESLVGCLEEQVSRFEARLVQIPCPNTRADQVE